MPTYEATVEARIRDELEVEADSESEAIERAKVALEALLRRVAHIEDIEVTSLIHLG
jgi:hypothetical protein